MIASPITAIAVSESLRDYLRFRLGVADLDFREAPSPITEGYATYIYRFQLGAADDLPEEFQRPLILRAYSSISGLPQLQHEAAVQRHMHARCYPAAEPLLVEESDGPLGGPFMIVEVLPGRTLLDELFRRFWRIVHAPIEMAEMQARLHRMPVDGFPSVDQSDSGDFLSRQLRDLRGMVEEYDLEGLRPGLEWLEEHRPSKPAQPSIIHLDFHPMNMLCRWRRCTGILDWSDADVGDRHADVASSLVLIRSAPDAIAKTLYQWLWTLPGRWLFWKSYLHAYRNRLPLDEQKLAYYMAWAALRRLCRRGMCVCTSPQANGCKPALHHYLSSERIDCLIEFIRKPSGVVVQV
jgi:aminoglycoside phosphotransferase (APT) family kinase protein